MTKKPKPSKPFAGAPSLKVDLDPLGDDAITYALIGEARVQGRGSTHEDVVRRVDHFLNHPTAVKLMKACGLDGLGFRATGYGVVDKERNRIVKETPASVLIDPHTGRPIGGH